VYRYISLPGLGALPPYPTEALPLDSTLHRDPAGDGTQGTSVLTLPPNLATPLVIGAQDATNDCIGQQIETANMPRSFSIAVSCCLVSRVIHSAVYSSGHEHRPITFNTQLNGSCNATPCKSECLNAATLCFVTAPSDHSLDAIHAIADLTFSQLESKHLLTNILTAQPNRCS